MSANPIIATDVVQHIGNTLNIDVSGKITALNIIKVLSSIPNLADLVEFIEEKFNYERFRYLTGYQKFITLVNEFKKENKLELSKEMKIKALTYSEDLFKRVTEICDEINFE